MYVYAKRFLIKKKKKKKKTNKGEHSWKIQVWKSHCYIYLNYECVRHENEYGNIKQREWKIKCEIDTNDSMHNCRLELI